MSSRRQRQRLREQRMEFDREVERNREQKMKHDVLEGLTRADLIKYAEESGLKVDKTAKKAEIKEEIIKHFDKE